MIRDFEATTENPPQASALNAVLAVFLTPLLCCVISSLEMIQISKKSVILLQDSLYETNPKL